MRVALITSCTNRKRVVPLRDLRAHNLSSAPLARLAADWVHRLRSARSRVPARDFYAGRGFTAALAAVEAYEVQPHIVSAGMGLIHVDDLVPPYSLTVAGRVSDNGLTRIKEGGGERPAQWWAALNDQLHQGHPLSRLIRSKSAD